MILSIIVLLIIGAITFFHYVQGFFSATISAICAIIAAVLAVSLHETVVESFLGGKFGNVAHAMALAVLFGVIYLILRVLFDKMVPGNLRVPAIVDKVGGAAMGVVAGLFAAGIVVLVAAYLPFMPSVAGYARYAVVDREVSLPAVRYGSRSQNSEVWHELKSDKAGQFDPADKGGLLLPVDDIVVKTVAHLSDNGSLAGRPLREVHPDLPTELFAQRLGVQTGAKRVATQDALTSVDLYTVPTLARKDHEYSTIRARALETKPLTAGPNQMILVVRVVFGRAAGDDDGHVRFSPATARLVARAAGGAPGEMANYIPLGTVDKAQTLYMSKPDDFLLVEVRGSDRGVDFAYLVDKNVVLASPNAPGPMKVAPGTFFEFKRMARKDLGDQTIKPASGYKAAETVLVLRKDQPDAPEATASTPDTPAAAPGTTVDEMKQKLVGNWAASTDTGQQIIEFQADGVLKFNNTPKQGLPNIGQGTWEAVRVGGPNALVIKRKIGDREGEATVTFADADNITIVSSATSQPLKLTRR